MMLDQIVEVFCEVDDFCQAFLPHWEASLLGAGGTAPRGPEPGLSPSEIITLLLTVQASNISRASLPASPSRWLLSRHAVQHFVSLQKSVFVPLVVFLLSHLGTGLYDIGSTALATIIALAGTRFLPVWPSAARVLRLQAAPRLQHRQ